MIFSIHCKASYLSCIALCGYWSLVFFQRDFVSTFNFKWREKLASVPLVRIMQCSASFCFIESQSNTIEILRLNNSILKSKKSGVTEHFFQFFWLRLVCFVFNAILVFWIPGDKARRNKVWLFTKGFWHKALDLGCVGEEGKYGEHWTVNSIRAAGTIEFLMKE